MIRRVVEAFGADYEQWRALTLVGIKLDLRNRRLGAQTRKPKRRTDLPPGIIVYVALGLMFAGVVAGTRDLMLGTLVIISYAMFMTATTVLLEYHTVVTAPDDYFVLGFRPVSSRTYFAARISNLLVFVLFTSTLFSIAPAVAAMLRGHLRPEVGVALYLGVTLGSVLMALLVVLVYAWLVHRVDARRLQRFLTYLQLIVSTVVYGGYAFLPRLLERSELTERRLQDSWLVLLYPPAWFASYTDLVLGHVSWRGVLGALATVVSLVAVARAAAGRISLDFAEKLSAMSVAVGPTKTRAREKPAEWSAARGESRAVWLLVRAQFRSDNKFRLAVLAILPLTLFYLGMALMNGGVVDPFAASTRGLADTGPIYIAIIMFPVLIMGAITSSDQYQASWVFFSTPADRQEVLLAMRRSVMIAFVLPYLAVIGIAFLFFLHNLLHVLTHLLMLGLICNITMLLVLLINPRLPFSQPRIKGERSRGLFGVGMVALFTSAFAIPFLTHFVYISARRTVVTLFALWLLGVVIEKLSRLRVRRLILKSEFTG